MKFLRLSFPAFISSLWAAGAVVLYLAFINYRVPLLEKGQLYAFGVLFGVYFLIIFLISLALSLFFYFIAGGAKITALNSRYLCALLFLFSSIFAGLFAYNTTYLKTLLVERVYFLCIANAVALFLIALLALSFIPRKSKTIFVLFSLFSFSLLALALYVRVNLSIKGNHSSPSPQLIEPPVRKVTLIYAEGFSADVLLSLVDREKLPNFSYLMEKGVWGRVRSFKPVEPVAVFYSALSGKYPRKTGVLSGVKYSVLGWGQLEVRPRWLMIETLRTVGLMGEKENRPEPPPMLVRVVRKAGSKAELIEGEDFTQPVPELVESLFPEAKKNDWQYWVLLESISRDWKAVERALRLRKRSSLTVLRLTGMREIKKYFLRYYISDYYPPAEPSEVEKYMDVIERYHIFYDQIIGRFLTLTQPDELFVFFSPFGVEPLPPWLSVAKLLLGEDRASGYWDEAPEGIFFAYCENLQPGTTMNISVLDLAPTLYYYLGLPVEKVSDGQLLSSAFRKEFIARNPIYFIYSYEPFVEKRNK